MSDAPGHGWLRTDVVGTVVFTVVIAVGVPLHRERPMQFVVGAVCMVLFAIGAATTLFTGRTVLFSGLRMVLFGLAAAAVTFTIGRLLGVNVAG